MRSIATFEDLLDLARRFEGPADRDRDRTALQCSRRQRSRAGLTPVSSGIGQTEGRKGQEQFLVRYLATGSMRPGDYADVSHNASCVIRLPIAAGDAATR
jgi:hypothetical protein